MFFLFTRHADNFLIFSIKFFVEVLLEDHFLFSSAIIAEQMEQIFRIVFFEPNRKNMRPKECFFFIVNYKLCK